MLTTADAQNPGGPPLDGFRIKIYNKNPDGSNGSVIYDNKTSTSTDDAISNNNTQAIAGGSIVIHTN